MNKRILHTVKATAFGGCIMFMVVSCKPNDSQIAKNASAAATAVNPNVKVKVQNGIVTLSGILSDTATKSTLDSTVKGLKGVVSVIDNTSFGPLPPPPPPPSAAPYPMIYTDTLVARTIDTAFKVEHISGVNVKVLHGVITLTGNAPKKDMRTILLIANESNPKKVINKITVK